MTLICFQQYITENTVEIFDVIKSDVVLQNLRALEWSIGQKKKNKYMFI